MRPPGSMRSASGSSSCRDDDDANMRAPARARASRRGLRARGPVGPPARDPGHGGARGSRRAHRALCGVGRSARGLRARVRRVPRGATRRALGARKATEILADGLRTRRHRGASTRVFASGSSRCTRARRDQAGFVNSLQPRRRGSLASRNARDRDPGRHLPPLGRSRRAVVDRARTPAASWGFTSATGRRSIAPTGYSRARASRERESSSRRSLPPAGTAPSMSRSSRRRSCSGACPRTKRRAAPTPP